MLDAVRVAAVRGCVVCVLALPLVSPGPLASQEEEGSAQPVFSHAAPVAYPLRIAEPISIDGRLDEPAWSRAVVIREFTQNQPLEGQPVSEPTEARILYDEDAIYFGLSLFDSGPIMTRLMRRDGTGGGGFDFVTIAIDSYHDHQTAYTFYVNPSGSIRDAVQSAGGGGGDASWDPVWDVDTQVTESGWFAEIRIPFTQLRFPSVETHTWGIQIERRILRKQETAAFSFTPSLERGGISRYGHLELTGVRQAQRIELLPYFGARAEYLSVPLADGTTVPNPFRSGSDYFFSVGLDVKYGITSNVTLNATVNPDFGQVEVDPAVINLTAFETRFTERRPFFVEGAEVFGFGEGGSPPQVLYSRRVGRSPQGSVPSGTLYSDVPDGATILGAVKLTGKMAGGWSVGLLEAVTAKEMADYLTEDDERASHEVEPFTNYLAGRVRRELDGNTARIGFLGTAVHRSLDGSDLADRLHSSAVSVGMDLAREWANRSFRASAAFAVSHVTGSATALERTQRSSARYFHRPDADHLDVDPAATSLSGYHATAEVAKRAGLVQWSLAGTASSPGFEVNDMGFHSSTDRITVDANLGYIQTRPGDHTQRWDVRGGPSVVWNYGGDRIGTDIGVSANVTLSNFWGLGGRVTFNPRVRNDRLTRGGPLSEDPMGLSGSANVSSDSRRGFVARTTYSWSFDESDSWRQSVSGNVTYVPRDNVQLTLGPSFARSYGSAQFVSTQVDATATDTYGRRYVFAGLDQTTVGFETRLNWTFTPKLSLELYMQPFLSSGDYGALKELRAPLTYEFLEYGQDIGTIGPGTNGRFLIDPDGAGPAASFQIRDQDFNVRSLLGNAVLRWEWRAGSTLYLVWQQTRSYRLTVAGVPGEPQPGGFALGDEVGEMFRIKPENVFQVKVNYWLSR